MDPDKLQIIAPTLEYEDGSTIQPNNPSSILVAQDVANPPGDANPFLVLGRNVKITYSFVDPALQANKNKNPRILLYQELLKKPAILL